MIGRLDDCDLALDGDGISRRHAVIQPRDGEWWILDRSRNGTFVNGERVERAVLNDGDLVGIGSYQARFISDKTRRGTTTKIVPRMVYHEEPVHVGQQGLTVAHAILEFTAGPMAGQSFTLTQPRTSLGSDKNDTLHLPDLPPKAMHIRVVRGRVMVEPGGVPMQVAGGRVPTVMPVHDNEEVSVGSHTFLVRTEFHEVTDDCEAFGELVGSTPPMRQMFGALSRIAAHVHPVLVVGESGTGKELAAQALHSEGPRADRPFVAVNCAALPDNLLESELFGHEKGAFTGASQRQDGAFQRAAGGTLFLDEIGELKLDAQAKLLRALESGEVRRVGAAKPEFPDARVIAATNRDLSEMVADGSFRGDLF
ncbi:MAG: sigma 54-interacting transcriptional regulator, partial [Myxococcota bacterium]